MRLYSHFIALTCVALLTACASNAPMSTDGVDASNNDITQQTLVAEAEAAAKLARQEELKLAAEEKVRVEAAQAEALRQQEVARKAAVIEAQRVAEEVRQQEAETQRQRELASRQAAEQAENIARQQAHIDELRAKIAASNSAMANLDEANNILLDAVVAAENLSTALGTEQQKYSSTDPKSGEMLEELATSTLAELTEEMERLRAQAQALISASE